MVQRMTGYNKCILIIFITALTMSGCREIPVPKPKGYFRIDLPGKEYTVFRDTVSKDGYLPVSFEYPVYGKILFDDKSNPEPGWFNVDFPKYKARIYLTYKDIHNDL